MNRGPGPDRPGLVLAWTGCHLPVIDVSVRQYPELPCAPCP